MRRRQPWVGAFLLAMACGEPDDPQPTASAAAKCDAYVAAHCDHQASCLGWPDEVRAHCRAVMTRNASCATAVATSEGYEGCMADIAAARCPSSGKETPPPYSCVRIILQAR